MLLNVSPVTSDTVSINTGRATAGSPDPTRTTATMEASNDGKAEGVAVELLDGDAETEPDALLDAVADDEPVPVADPLPDALEDTDGPRLDEAVPELDGVPVPVEDSEPV